MKKQHILFTDDIASSGYDWQETKQSLIENGMNESEITDQDIQNEIEQQLSFDYDDFMERVKNFDKKHHKKILITGRLGLWNGSPDVRDIENTLLEAITKCLEDTNTIYTQTTKSTLEIKASHHDGSNCFKLYAITSKGEKFIADHEYDYGDFILCDKLIKNNYIRAIRLED